MSSSSRLKFAATIAAVLGLSMPPSVFAQSGLQITPDGRRTLVSKDVNGERWAIQYDEERGTALGNVFFPGGEEPKFVSCDVLYATETEIESQCRGSDRCVAAPCTEDLWTHLGGVRLPRTFFQPREGSEDSAAASGLVEERAGGEQRDSGVQVTPRAGGLLISKDVGEERWAITQNLDDRTVTGNVFYADGRDPKFVWCTETSKTDDELSFSCLGADSCRSATCAAEDWSPIDDVTLPRFFFRPDLPVEDALTLCRRVFGAGDMVSAEVACAGVDGEGQAEGALRAAFATFIRGVFESRDLLGLMSSLDVAPLGSAFDLCELGLELSFLGGDTGAVAPGAPRMGVIQETLVRELVPPIRAALDGLASVPEEATVLLHPATLPPCFRLLDQPTVEVDAADVVGVRSVLSAAEGLLHLVAAYDLDFDVAAELENDRTLVEILHANPNMLQLRDGTGDDELGEARSSFDAALESFIELIDRISEETDDPSDDILVIDPVDEELVDLARDAAERIQTALSGEATFEADLFDLPSSQTVRLGPLFDGEVESLRSVIPPLGTDFSECSLADPTVAGLFPDATQEVVASLFAFGCK